MTKYKLRTDPKFLRRQFEKAVGKSVSKILTELITNSDDSYKRMLKENDARTTEADYGKISIVVNYRKKTVTVVDQAQGFSRDEMKRKFTIYGKESEDKIKEYRRDRCLEKV